MKIKNAMRCDAGCEGGYSLGSIDGWMMVNGPFLQFYSCNGVFGHAGLAMSSIAPRLVHAETDDWGLNSELFENCH